MRRGLLRSLSGLLGGTAFAVAVASPIQWCPCPLHGAALPVHAAHASAPDVQMPGGMPMPAAGHEGHAAHSHGNHGTGSPHSAHQCTCPGGCCSTTPVGLLAHTLRASFLAHVDAPASVATPTDAIELVSSPQLVLPLANAPPRIRVTLHSAA